MDYIKRPYVGRMRFWVGDQERIVRVLWQYAKPGANPMPFAHRFYSHVWEDARDDPPEVGEVGRVEKERWIPPSELPGHKPCGDVAVWRNGADEDDPAFPVDERGVPRCCGIPVWSTRYVVELGVVPPAVPLAVELVAELASVGADAETAAVELVADLDGVGAGSGGGVAAVELVADLASVGADAETAAVELVADLVAVGLDEDELPGVTVAAGLDAAGTGAPGGATAAAVELVAELAGTTGADAETAAVELVAELAGEAESGGGGGGFMTSVLLLEGLPTAYWMAGMPAEMAVGLLVSGVGVQPGSVVTSYSPSSFTMSLPAVSPAGVQDVTFTPP